VNWLCVGHGHPSWCNAAFFFWLLQLCTTVPGLARRSAPQTLKKEKKDINSQRLVVQIVLRPRIGLKLRTIQKKKYITMKSVVSVSLLARSIGQTWLA
jgi:hypothetical protein